MLPPVLVKGLRPFSGVLSEINTQPYYLLRSVPVGYSVPDRIVERISVVGQFEFLPLLQHVGVSDLPHPIAQPPQFQFNFGDVSS